MVDAIKAAKRNKDTLGGMVEVQVKGHPPGLGSCMRWQDKLDGRLMQAVGSVQAIKAVEIGLGVVNVEPGRVDSVETIIARVEQALKYLAPERITLNPDCGFAPGSGAVVDMDEVYTKLQNEVQAARILRERYS